MAKYSNKKEIIFESFYRGYEINNPNYSNGCYKESLDKIIDTVEGETKNHSKVLIARMDIRKPAGIEIENASRKVTRAIEGFKREQERKFGDSPHSLDMKVIRSTERKAGDKNTHDHLLIAVNGNCIQNAYPLFQSLERHVERILIGNNDTSENHGLVERCASTGDKGCIINRNSDDFEEMKAKAIYDGSYLAKVYTKQNTPKGTHKISLSQSKKKKLNLRGGQS